MSSFSTLIGKLKATAVAAAVVVSPFLASNAEAQDFPRDPPAAVIQIQNAAYVIGAYHQLDKMGIRVGPRSQNIHDRIVQLADDRSEQVGFNIDTIVSRNYYAGRQDVIQSEGRIRLSEVDAMAKRVLANDAEIDRIHTHIYGKLWAIGGSREVSDAVSSVLIMEKTDTYSLPPTRTLVRLLASDGVDPQLAERTIRDLREELTRNIGENFLFRKLGLHEGLFPASLEAEGDAEPKLQNINGTVSTIKGETKTDIPGIFANSGPIWGLASAFVTAELQEPEGPKSFDPEVVCPFDEFDADCELARGVEPGS